MYKMVLVALLCLFLVALPCSNSWGIAVSSPPLTAAAQQPNIVLIFADDLDYESFNHMPKAKALLAAQGASFTNFFTGLSVCCPSRASILRGQYAHNHQVLGNHPPTGGFTRFRDLQLERSTVATLLQASGYHTMLIGKYFNGYPDRDDLYVPPGWDEWYSKVEHEKKPSEDGPSSYYNYTVNQNKQLIRYGNSPNDYWTDVESRLATDAIQRASKDSKPFFMYLSVNAPHTPLIPAPRHINALPEVRQAPRSKAFNQQDVSDKPEFIRKLPLLNKKKIAKVDEAYRTRLQMMLAVDDLVENVVNELIANGTLDNTYIFFTSDNGYHFGLHRMPTGKGTLYEDDIRVPMIVRGPGVLKNTTITSLAGNIDLTPTFAELAGASLPGFVDGRSLIKLLKNEPNNEQERNFFLLERFFQAPSFGLRSQRYKYVEYDNGEREFYDLSKDPDEVTNLAKSADAGLIQKFSSYLGQMKQCKGSDCRKVESQPVP